jgi:hypothetical protein
MEDFHSWIASVYERRNKNRLFELTGEIEALTAELTAAFR